MSIISMLRCGKFLSLLIFTSLSAVHGVSDEQCLGGAPMESVSTFLGMTLDYGVADNICCHNHRFAEFKGYLAAPEVDLFSQLNETAETVFYDSVCGIPLFIAPRGRTFEEFKKESLYHGWPSFRPEEIISQNVIIHFDGRMESKCLTHLGHNLPKDGVDRYCIDLVCIAGTPLTPQLNATQKAQVKSSSLASAISDVGVLSADEFNPDTYVSSAEQWSGKNPQAKTNVILGGIFGGIAVISLVLGATWILKRRKRNRDVATKSYQDSLDIEPSSTESA